MLCNVKTYASCFIKNKRHSANLAKCLLPSDYLRELASADRELVLTIGLRINCAIRLAIHLYAYQMVFLTIGDKAQRSRCARFARVSRNGQDRCSAAFSNYG